MANQLSDQVLISFDLPNDSIAVRLDYSTNKVLIKGTPQVRVEKDSTGAYHLILDYPIDVAYEGPKTGIKLSTGDNFYVAPNGDAFNHPVTPSVTVRKDQVSGNAILAAEAILTTGVKVEHGS